MHSFELVDRDPLEIGIATLELTRAKFNPTLRSKTLTSGMESELIRYAEFREVFPPSLDISLGRSIYAKTGANSEWMRSGVSAIKAKGIAGLARTASGMGYAALRGRWLVVDSLTHVISPPIPLMPFVMPDRVHISIEHDLRVRSKISPPKYWFSLTKNGAETEWHCQERLAEHSLGFGALMAGEFLWRKGHPEIDGSERPTGAVFLKQDANAQLVAKYSHFSSYKTPQGTLRIFSPSLRTTKIEDTEGRVQFAKIIQNSIEFSAKIADVKSRAITQAKVARHSSHDGNAWYQSSKDRVMLSDNDTCLLLDNEPEELHGVILLRDFSTFLGRTLRELSLFAFDETYFDGLETLTFQPVHRVLSALFSEHAKESDINETASAITKQYLTFIQGETRAGGKYTQRILEIAKKFNQAMFDKAERGIENYNSIEARIEWEIIHLHFYRVITSELYALCRKSSLAGIGFHLPEIPARDLERTLEGDLNSVADVYQTEFEKDKALRQKAAQTLSSKQ